MGGGVIQRSLFQRMTQRVEEPKSEELMPIASAMDQEDNGGAKALDRNKKSVFGLDRSNHRRNPSVAFDSSVVDNKTKNNRPRFMHNRARSEGVNPNNAGNDMKISNWLMGQQDKKQPAEIYAQSG